jgi:glycosyltransferase involved in cell wall biosynthesis
VAADLGPPLRIGFDVSPLVQTQAGTARHIRGLMGALAGRAGLDIEPLVFGGRSRLATVLRDAVWYPLGMARNADRLDLIHCTTFRGPYRARVPVVLTLHDLGVLRHPEAFRRWHRVTARAALQGARRAAALLAVSEFTKREAVELVGVSPDRVHVVPNGVDPVFVPDGGRADGDYVLAVGTLEPRKNLERVVAAARRTGLELRVVGARGWGGVDVPGWIGRPPDDELAQLYRGARCVVYASLYEGFGLPVLESMACGTPVVTSARTATQEVAGDAAVLVDPESVDAIAAGIAEADARRAELVPAGIARARAFTWTRAADTVEAVWRSLA